MFLLLWIKKKPTDVTLAAFPEQYFFFFFLFWNSSSKILYLSPQGNERINTIFTQYNFPLNGVKDISCNFTTILFAYVCLQGLLSRMVDSL